MTPKKYLFCVLGLAIFVSAGCSFLNSKSNDVHLDDSESQAKAVDRDRLKAGGGIVVIPFRAGSGVAQTDDLEKIALMFVKGFIEVMSEKGGSLRVMAPDEAADSDFIFKGHITRLTQTKGVKKWLSKAKDVEMAVDGEIVDRETGQTLFVFSDKRRVTQETPDFYLLSYAIGRDTAQLVVSTAHD